MEQSTSGKVSEQTTPAPDTTEATTPRSLVVALGVVMIAAFMDLLDATIVSVAAPAIAADLGASGTALQWTVAGYTLALGSGLVTGGWIGDSFGRRRVFLAGLSGFVLASAGCALAPDPTWLIVLRVAQGLAAGLMVPQVFGIIRSSFAPAAQAKAFGAYGAVLSLASVVGPLLGGLLAEADLFGLGWRTIFWVNIPIGVLGLILGARVIPESKAPGAARLDLLGAALISAAAVLVLLPLVQGREWGWPAWSFVLLALAVPTVILFGVHERRLQARGGQPILGPALLRVKAFSSGLAISLLFFGALGSFFLLLALYLQLGTGRTALDTGLVILPYAVGSILTSGLGVALAARAGRALLITGGLALAASQAWLLLVVRDGADPGYWTLAAPMFLGGLGLGLTAPILVNVVMAGVPGRDAGTAAGVLSTVTQIGNAASVAVLGTIFFTALTDTAAIPAAGPVALATYGNALTTILPWQIACYLAAAALMLLLPRRATSTT